jgi:hypothetical protein
VVVFVLFINSVARAQEPAQPGPQHAKLKEMEGEWEVLLKIGGAESKGKVTYKMSLNGLRLISDFQAELGGMPFPGHALDGYDMAKGKYIGIGVDSMSSVLMFVDYTRRK